MTDSQQKTDKADICRFAADVGFSFLVSARVDTIMNQKFPTFQEWLAMHEGLLLPDKPPAPGLSRINVTPLTNDQRKRLVSKPAKAPNPFKPTVAKIVPPAKPAFMSPKFTKVPRPRLP